jgi:hypothetical protein
MHHPHRQPETGTADVSSGLLSLLGRAGVYTNSFFVSGDVT